jgi:ATP-dependent protease ClpP protease subunit
MIHNPWTFAMGDAEAMLKTAGLLEQIKGSIITTYRTKTSLDETEIAALMDAETWFDAQGAVDAGLASAIVGKSQNAKNTAKAWIRNAPHIPEEPVERLKRRERFAALIS